MGVFQLILKMNLSKYLGHALAETAKPRTECLVLFSPTTITCLNSSSYRFVNVHPLVHQLI